MAEAISNSYPTEDLEVLLGGMGIPDETRAKFEGFVFGYDALVDTDIKYASLALGRLYFASLNSNTFTNEYSEGEQIMLGLVAGRTAREDPRPISRAAADFSANYGDSRSLEEECRQLFISGLRKLRERTERKPQLFHAGMLALQNVTHLLSKSHKGT